MCYTLYDMREKPIAVNITSGTVLLVLFFLLVGWFLYEIKSVLLIVISAVVFSLALAPGKRFLMRFKIPEPIAVLLLYVVVFIIFAFCAYSLFPIFVQQYQVFVDALPSLFEVVRGWFDGTIFEGLVAGDQLSAVFADSNQFAQSFIKSTGASVLSIFGGIVNIILFLLLTFLFAVNPKSLDTFLHVVTPIRYRAYVEDLWKRTQVKMGQWFQGQLVLMCIVGALVYFALSVLGIQNALFLAVFAGLMEVIPIFGPVIGAIPAVLMALTTGDITLVLLVIGVFVIIQQLESALIYPLVVSKVVGISSVLIILAVVVGGSIAGFVGVLIAVPLAGVIQEFFSDVESGKLQKLKKF